MNADDLVHSKCGGDPLGLTLPVGRLKIVAHRQDEPACAPAFRHAAVTGKRCKERNGLGWNPMIPRPEGPEIRP